MKKRKNILFIAVAGIAIVASISSCKTPKCPSMSYGGTKKPSNSINLSVR